MWPNDFADWYQWAYEQVHGAVYRYLRRRALPHDRARDLAEEATQEAARRAAERIGTPGYFESREHLRNWMIQVARNYARDQFARQRAGQFPDGHDLAQRPSSREEFYGLLWECFRQLSPEDQRILDWKYWDRLTDAQIGQILFAPSSSSSEALGQRARNLRLAAEARLETCLLLRGIDPSDWNF